ncbi:O-succinylhomoserine sulfhydrylase [Saccharospirillum sp. MSK14-1]|uniref:O-succinylhomoserine sulfhydrylase n=1 Tax=Saccharospirillum sp. MSK14-1 TaxID=1897632 RepID=UPI000D3B85E1|nr:O-succinylhomoserine sulfhydrylase [Saccharospirillum sp. MSK14-1]PTY36441.1 O-succinylhomoserine sulfhydrylase [Saccharospirillum sp. MSK14-1]
MSDERTQALQQARPATRAVRGGQRRSDEMEHSEALYMTSSYVFDDAASMADTFAGEREGNVYSRYTNPTVRTFEERLALLEGGEAAVGTSSGMAAIFSICMAFLQSGDEVVSSRSIFGSTNVVFNKYLGKFGISTRYVDPKDLSAWRDAITDQTKLLFVETPSNPLSEVADIRALAELARSVGALLVVDNCFCTPALQQPLALGADLVVHSATKFIDGQGRALGGAVVGRKTEIDEIVGFLRSAGPSMSPFNAWVFLKGLETLSLRMAQHCANAQTLAEWLEAQPQVVKVHFLGLPSHPQHQLAREQQSDFGGVVSFVVKGGQEAAWKVIDATRILSITANLGDAKTTITHPYTTTHGRVGDEEKMAAGIEPGLIRVAVGLEDVLDIQDDLMRGLQQL